MRIALVLGAGGSVGVAYHGAVLSALQEVTGWDPRRASIVIGTSAGAITASILRAGVPADDLKRISEGEPLSDEGARLADLGRPHRPRPSASHILQFRPMADPGAIIHAVSHLRSHPGRGLVAAILPGGGIPTDAISAGIDAVYDGSWPSDPLWICAVDLRGGRRVVFGRADAPVVTVGVAVAASSALPGYFKPVSIHGRRYVDGGVRSMVNVDLQTGRDLDLVIVSSPMSQSRLLPAIAADTFMRQSIKAQLRVEANQLRRKGVPVVAVEPGRRVASAMGLNPMDARRRGGVSRATRAGVRRWMV